MSFVSKNLQQTTNAMSFIKGATLFFLGASCVLFLARAFEVVPIASNAVMFIKSIFLTASGNNASATGIILEGNGGNAWFKGDITIDSLTGAGALGTNASGKIIALSATGLYDYISGFALSGPTGATGPAGVTGPAGFLQAGITGATPYRNGSAWVVTDTNIFNTGGNIGIGTATPGEKLQIGTYARIGKNTTAMYGTGGSFLRINGGTTSTHACMSGNPCPNYEPNIQLNYIGIGSSWDSWRIATNSQGTLMFGYDDAHTFHNNKMVIKNDGTVGINTSSPDCGGISTCGLHVDDKDTYFNGDFATMNGNVGIGYNVLNSAGSGNLYVLNKIGIGIPTASEKLQVNGNVLINAPYTIKIPQGAGTGRVLMSDASGTASRQSMTTVSRGGEGIQDETFSSCNGGSNRCADRAIAPKSTYICFLMGVRVGDNHAGCQISDDGTNRTIAAYSESSDSVYCRVGCILRKP